MKQIKASKWILRSTALSLLGCAACATVSVDQSPPRKCSLYVNQFLQRTEHAKAPDVSQADHGRFEIAEAGQLELSDMDKILAKETLAICEKEGQDAYDRAKLALKPWYKRIFAHKPPA